MDKHISVQLMEGPFIYIDGEKVNFPYKKVEGLFYYLCVKKRISRNEAMGVLWADYSEEGARKNLRDALYNIRKLLGSDVLVLEGNAWISLNEEKILEIDTDRMNSNSILEAYKGEFLRYFYVKNCYEFENWMEQVREEFKQKYIRALIRKVAKCRGSGDEEFLISCGEILLQNSVWDEEGYRMIMKKLAKAGRYRNAVELYQKLANELQVNLELEPEYETRKIYEKICEMKSRLHNAEVSSGEFFYGRSDILYRIYTRIGTEESVHNLRVPQSFIVTGEAGIGKSMVLQKIGEMMDSSQFVSFSWNCCQTEKELYLKPWHGILYQVETYCHSNGIAAKSSTEVLFQQDISDIHIFMTQFELITESIFRYLAQNIRDKKIVLFFDDFQWMDTMSRRLMSNLLFRMGNRNLVLIAACRDEYSEELNTFKIPLIGNGLLEEIELPPFTSKETAEIVKRTMDGEMQEEAQARRFYESTQGNPLFLMELLQLVKEKNKLEGFTPKITNVIKGRLMDIDEDETEVVHVLSVFPMWADLDELQCVLGWERIRLSETIEKLLQRKLVCECVGIHKTHMQFKHQMIRDYVYSSLSDNRKNIYHGKIAIYYEKKYEQTADFSLCSMLIYHFQRCRNTYKMYWYKVESLKVFYTVRHEMYPLLQFAGYDSTISEDELTREDELAELAEEIRSLQQSGEYLTPLLMKIEYILGRYYMHKGKYKKGLRDIEHSILLAKECQDAEALFECYIQLIIYAEMTENAVMGEKYIELCKELLNQEEYHPGKYCMVLCHEGRLLLKKGAYDEAMDILQSTIMQLEAICVKDNTYQIVLAACYNNMGECHMAQSQWEEALFYLGKAVSCCSDDSSLSSYAMFNINRAVVYYQMGDRAAMLEISEKIKEYGSLARRFIEQMGYEDIFREIEG